MGQATCDQFALVNVQLMSVLDASPGCVLIPPLFHPPPSKPSSRSVCPAPGVSDPPVWSLATASIMSIDASLGTDTDAAPLFPFAVTTLDGVTCFASVTDTAIPKIPVGFPVKLMAAVCSPESGATNHAPAQYERPFASDPRMLAATLL